MCFFPPPTVYLVLERSSPFRCGYYGVYGIYPGELFFQFRENGVSASFFQKIATPAEARVRIYQRRPSAHHYITRLRASNFHHSFLSYFPTPPTHVSHVLQAIYIFCYYFYTSNFPTSSWLKNHTTINQFFAPSAESAVYFFFFPIQLCYTL